MCLTLPTLLEMREFVTNNDHLTPVGHNGFQDPKYQRPRSEEDAIRLYLLFLPITDDCHDYNSGMAKATPKAETVFE
jgi:hypothetical protein